jgi:hypothetical protein
MQILLSHWHCILPIAGVLVAMFLMRGKQGDKENTDGQIGEQYRK